MNFIKELFSKRVRLSDGSYADCSSPVLVNSFCATGPGGGVDATCSPGAKVEYPRGRERVDQKSVQMFGRALEPREWAQLCGGDRPGAEVRVTPSAGRATVAVVVDHGDFYMERQFTKIDGELVCHNTMFRVFSPGNGLGADLFEAQALELSKRGFSKIETNAARNEDMNGYYTWPRFGYDASLGLQVYGESRSAVAREAKDKFGAERLSQLMSTEAGRVFWKERGFSVDCEFDLNPSGPSMQRLRAYRRYLEGQLVAAERSYEADLTPAQEAALDAAWAEVTVNAFCPTGKGGGVDPSCSPHSERAAKMVAEHDADPHVQKLHEQLRAAKSERKRCVERVKGATSAEEQSEALGELHEANRRGQAVSDAIAHEERRAVLLAFHAPLAEQAVVHADTGPSTSHATKNWNAAKDYLERLMTKDGAGNQFVIVRATSGRPYCDGLTIRTSPTDSPAISAHEFGHRLEETESVLAKVQEFRAKRFDPKDDVGLVEKLGRQSGYGRDERGNPDDMRKLFHDESYAHYVGKTYPGGRTEVLSMGLEMLYRAPVHFARVDPEYFSLVMDCLQGGRRGRSA